MGFKMIYVCIFRFLGLISFTLDSKYITLQNRWGACSKQVLDAFKSIWGSSLASPSGRTHVRKTCPHLLWEFDVSIGPMFSKNVLIVFVYKWLLYIYI